MRLTTLTRTRHVPAAGDVALLRVRFHTLPVRSQVAATSLGERNIPRKDHGGCCGWERRGRERIGH